MRYFNRKKICTILTVVSIVTAFSYTAAYAAESPMGVIIDPGHGGIDEGAVVIGVKEKNITLDISKNLKDYLKQKGYKVSMTRESDISLYKLSRAGNTIQQRDLNTRVQMINDSKAGFFISIHVNSASRYPHESGSIVYYGSMPQSRELAYYIQKSLNNIVLNNQKRKAHNIEVSKFYIQRNTKIPGVLVETGFISNNQERNLLTKASFKNTIAKAIADAVEKYNTTSHGKTPNTNKYRAVSYQPGKGAAESKFFESAQDGYKWLRSKKANGILYDGISSGQIMGVCLQGYIISFDSDYIVGKSTTNKPDPKVAAVQALLGHLGYRLKADGYFGNDTYNAVVSFQSKFQLNADGIIGKDTYVKLSSV